MARCKGFKADGTPCKAHAVHGSDFCWFHGGGPSKERKSLDLSESILYRRGSFSYEKLFGKRIEDIPRVDKIKKFTTLYDSGGLVATGIDAYVSTAVSNGFQIIDGVTGERGTDNTEIIEELDRRINIHETSKKIFRSFLINGYCWGEIKIDGKKIKKLLFYPPEEIVIERERDVIKEIKQVRGTEEIAKWSGKKLKNVFFMNKDIKHSEKYGKGLLERVYDDAKSVKEMGEDLDAVVKFVAYPFRVVKVGSDTYPASKQSVDDVADEVEDLEPGDWLATRHNLEFEFHSPKTPEALAELFRERVKSLVVTLGVPNIYTQLDNIDAQSLKEIRNLFNSTVRSMQLSMARQFEDQIIKYQLDLLGKLPKLHDVSPAILSWNPLTVSVLSILELTNLVNAGVIGAGEARRILESMGYGLLRGDKYIEEIKKLREALAPPEIESPKESHPTEDDPEKKPSKEPQKDGEIPKTKQPSSSPVIKRPQPNSPKMSFEQWMEGIKVLQEKDPYLANILLELYLAQGFNHNI